MVAAVIGGTGDLGRAVALRLALGGVPVRLGSRDLARAVAAAAEIAALAPLGDVRGAGNREAAAAADVCFLCVPDTAQVGTLRDLAEPLAGKILVDATVCLAPDDPTRIVPPPEGSAAERAAALLPRTRVIAALQTVAARRLLRGEDLNRVDALVAGDDPDAKAVATELIEQMGVRPLDAGPLRNAQTLERLTALIIGLNQHYKRRHIAIQFTGL
jgi:NADPH-dependent F420 reductase